MENREIVLNLYEKINNFPFVIIKEFEKDEIIANFINNRNYIYIILSGKCNLIKNSSRGEEILIEKYEEYDFFGDMFHNIILNNEMSVIAKSKCKIMYFNFDTIKNNPKLFFIYPIILDLETNKLKDMNVHTEVLSGKTIRDRLLSYLNILTKKSVKKIAYIDMSYKELSSYLNVNRSALMRELNNLEQEKIIKRNKKKIELLF